jgi:hypothetical protein
MIIDAREYPKDYLLTQVAAQQLGRYVYVAQFTEHHDQRMFRLIIDGEIDSKDLTAILTGCVKDQWNTYEFSHLESITGPIIDQGARPSATTNYLRVTFSIDPKFRL